MACMAEALENFPILSAPPGTCPNAVRAQANFEPAWESLDEILHPKVLIQLDQPKRQAGERRLVREQPKHWKIIG